MVKVLGAIEQDLGTVKAAETGRSPGAESIANLDRFCCDLLFVDTDKSGG